MSFHSLEHKKAVHLLFQGDVFGLGQNLFIFYKPEGC